MNQFHQRSAIDEIFAFERRGQSERGRSIGAFRASGHTPRVMDRLRAYGVNLSPSIFEEVVEVH